MKRNDVINKIGIGVLDTAKVRVIIDTDCANEADDHFAIMHHLLSPSLIIEGIIATHFEEKESSKNTMVESYNEILDLLKVANIDDVNVYKGQRLPLKYECEDSLGVDAIIKEAKKPGKLYIACQGALTNVAKALLKDESIKNNIVVIFNGGHPYEAKRCEFNVMQDIIAARTIFEMEGVEIWQIPQDCYSTLEVSLAELKYKCYPCGKVGEYLYNNVINKYESEYKPYFKLRTGENWTLGDNATIGALLLNNYRGLTKMVEAPSFDENGFYTKNKIKKEVKVFTSIDSRFILEDFFSKLNLAYKN